jgi:hypothetical protein
LLAPLRRIGRKRFGGPGFVCLKRLGHQPRVFQSDADPLPARRIVVAGGVPDQDDTGNDRVVDPDVIVGIAVAGTRWPGPRKRIAVRKRRPVKRLQKPFDRALIREPVALIETVGGVQADSPLALRKNIKPKVAIDADRLFIRRPFAGVIDQKTGQDVMDRIGKPLEPDLTGNRGAAAIGPNDDPR